MSIKFGPTIVLVGVTPEFRKDLVLHIGNSYNFLEIQTKFSVKALMLIPKLELFFFDFDQTNIKFCDFITAIKSEERYSNVPVIGLALKRHIDSLNLENKNKVDDIVLLPASMEDVLTRIDVWRHTAKAMKSGK
jgi:hypothetical protein